MTQAKDPASDWIQEWLQQQREQLQRLHTSATGEGEVAAQLRDIGQRWLDVGQSYLRGWTQFAQQGAAGQGGSTAAGEAPSKVGEELFNAWQGAWAGTASAGETTTQQFFELLARAPALGLAREHTEAWREVVAAQTEYRRLEQELRAVLTRVQADALALLERRVRERAGSASAIGSYRALYDLWVECGEEVYAQVAHSEAYCKLQAQFGNAAMRLRARMQAVLERGLKQLDLPTRSELNTVHRQMRELRERITVLEAQLAEQEKGDGSIAAAERRSKFQT